MVCILAGAVTAGSHDKEALSKMLPCSAKSVVLLEFVNSARTLIKWALAKQACIRLDLCLTHNFGFVAGEVRAHAFGHSMHLTIKLGLEQPHRIRASAAARLSIEPCASMADLCGPEWNRICLPSFWTIGLQLSLSAKA